VELPLAACPHGPPATPRTQHVRQADQVLLQRQRGGVPRACDLRSGRRHGRQQGCCREGLANTADGAHRLWLPWLYGLLPQVHQRLQRHRSTYHATPQAGGVSLDADGRCGIRVADGGPGRCTHPPATGLHQAIHHR
jgi:hypothetical protein